MQTATQTVGTWGKSLAIRIPKSADVFRAGDKVEISVIDGTYLKIAPVKKRRTMDEILADDGRSMGTSLLDFGPAAGEETDL